MTLAKMKSAKALSGEIPLKSEKLAGLLWIRRHTVEARREYCLPTWNNFSLLACKRKANKNIITQVPMSW